LLFGRRGWEGEVGLLEDRSDPLETQNAPENGRRYGQDAHIGRLEERDVLGQPHRVVRLQGAHLALHAYQVADRQALTTRQQNGHSCIPADAVHLWLEHFPEQVQHGRSGPAADPTEFRDQP
jgi:hypothetical protein